MVAPGASFTFNGGGYNDSNGTAGPVYGLAEQWVNLSVALELRDLLGPVAHSLLWDCP